jgi:hypothetical protein
MADLSLSSGKIVWILYINNGQLWYGNVSLPGAAHEAASTFWK